MVVAMRSTLLGLFACSARGVVEIQLDEMGAGACTSSQYFDTTNLVCRSCTNGCSAGGSNCHKVPDYDSGVDPYGNALSCTCELGYLRVEQWRIEYDDADSDWPGGENVGFLCTRGYDTVGDKDDDEALATAGARGPTTLSDGSGIASCGATTQGIDADTGDCSCGTSTDTTTFSLDVLVEADSAGNYMSNKSCVSCPPGAGVVTEAGVYAGASYSADLYECQRCPDPHMDMALDRCATCDTSAGYRSAPTGLASLGARSCVYETHATSMEAQYNSGGSTAYAITYRQLYLTPDSFPRRKTAEPPFTLTSSTLQHYFLNATVNCYYFKGPQNAASCQTLANLCVLQLYDPSSSVCRAYLDLEAARRAGSYEQNNWGVGLPWLHYDETALEVRGDTSIEMVMALDPSAVEAGNADASELDFYLSTTALNGTWLGLAPLDSQLFYCPAGSFKAPLAGSSEATSWMRYGNSFSDTRRCDLNALLDMEPLFYELFLKDAATGNLYPVPVLLRDYVDSSGLLTNWNNDVDDEPTNVFVRRFHLFDPVSGISEGYGPGSPRVLRYVNEIDLKVYSDPDDASKLQAPILELKYSAREPKGGNWEPGMRRDQIRFTVEYAQARTDYIDTLYGFFTTTSILSALAAFLRWQNWSFRNLRAGGSLAGGGGGTDLVGEGNGGGGGNGGGAGLPGMAAGFALTLRNRECANLQRLLRSLQWNGILIIAHSLAIFTVLLLLGLSTVFFVLFKLQSRAEPAYLLLPPATDYRDAGDDYYFFWVLVYTCFFAQSGFLAQLLYLQCTAEVFFVDMENGNHSASASSSAASGSSSDNASSAPLLNNSSNGAGANNSSGGGNNANGATTSSGAATLAAESSVSAWRRIFVANEWNRLQGCRRTSLELTLVVIAFAFMGRDLEALAAPQPRIDDHNPLSCGSDLPRNMILRFCSSTWWFIVLEVGQLLIQHFRSHLACVGLETEPKGAAFVDLCTVAKVSVLLLDDNYHGYLLYCDSSAESADTSLRSLTRQLLVEMKGLVASRRGPAHLADRPGFDDAQAFELYVCDGWLRWYRTLRHRLDSLAAKHPSGVLASNTTTGGYNASSNGGPPMMVPGGARGANGGGRSSGGSRGGACRLLRRSLEERQAVLGVGGMEVLSDKLRRFFRRQYRGELEWEAVAAVQGPLAPLWRLLRAVPLEIAESRMENVLVPDPAERFMSCALYGIEFELWLRDVLTFAICDLWFNDAMTSIFLTWLSYHAIRAVRIYFGTANLATTSLVDKTFLF